MAEFPQVTVTEIPLFPDQPSYRMTVTLSGIAFVLALDYSGRSDRWYLSVFDSQGNAIEVRRKARINWPMIRRSVSAARPKGALVFFDASSDLAPGFSDLGRRVRLMYIDPDPIPPEPPLVNPG